MFIINISKMLNKAPCLTSRSFSQLIFLNHSYVFAFSLNLIFMVGLSLNGRLFHSSDTQFSRKNFLVRRCTNGISLMVMNGIERERNERNVCKRVKWFIEFTNIWFTSKGAFIQRESIGH